MKRGLVSILMPTYNRRDFIVQAIDSVRSQTYPNWELIIIDDGSTDGTSEVVKAVGDVRIQYHYLQNGDQLNALIQGIPFVHGEFVAMLHSDDGFADESVLDRLVRSMGQGTDALYGDLIAMDGKGARQRQIPTAACTDGGFLPTLLMRFCSSTVNDHFFVTREVFDRFVVPNYFKRNIPFFVDYGRGKPLRMKKVEPYYLYRLHAGNYANEAVGRFVVFNGKFRTAVSLIGNGFYLPWFLSSPLLLKAVVRSRMSGLFRLKREDRAACAFGLKYFLAWKRELPSKHAPELTLLQIDKIIHSFALQVAGGKREKPLLIDQPAGRVFEPPDARQFYLKWPDVGATYQRLLRDDYDYIVAGTPEAYEECRAALDFYSLNFPLVRR